MKQRITAGFAACLMGIFLVGCGAENTVYLERTTEEVAGVASSEDDVPADDEDSLEEGMSSKDIEGTEQESAKPLEETGSCYVYVCGAVREPGVYELPVGGRIYEAIELAGGLTEDACLESLNQAEQIVDGQMIRVLTREEAADQAVNLSAGNAGTDGDTASDSGSSEDDGLIDLNTASASELMTLPGIGQSKADSIIAYRESKGGFSSISEIMNIDGIKEGVYNRIKEYIKVK